MSWLGLRERVSAKTDGVLGEEGGRSPRFCGLGAERVVD